MAGLWLENGLHLQIQNSLAKELAAEIQKNGSAEYLGSKIRMVKPDSTSTIPIPIDNSKRLRDSK